MANKTGKGGFKDNPQNINKDGSPNTWNRWDFTYNKILECGDVEQFEPQTVKEKIAVIKIKKALDGHMGAIDSIEDRTDGKARQSHDVTSENKNYILMTPEEKEIVQGESNE